MNLLIIQLTYIQVRIINFCIIVGLILAAFAISGYIEQKKEKHAKAEAKACERKQRQLQQAVKILKGEKYITGFEKKPEVTKENPKKTEGQTKK